MSDGARECDALGSLLSVHARGRLAGPDATRLAHHLESCAQCRGVATALRTVWCASHDPRVDLWPRLRARLTETEETEWVKLRFPPLTWRVGAALATTLGTLMVIPEPLRFLAAFGVF